MLYRSIYLSNQYRFLSIPPIKSCKTTKGRSTAREKGAKRRGWHTEACPPSLRGSAVRSIKKAGGKPGRKGSPHPRISAAKKKQRASKARLLNAARRSGTGQAPGQPCSGEAGKENEKTRRRKKDAGKRADNGQKALLT